MNDKQKRESEREERENTKHYLQLYKDEHEITY